jgi:pyruvate dehydrogenase E1 component beta subunit
MLALSEALEQEMRRDPTVVAFGEDSIGGSGCDGPLGHAWGATKGLHEKVPGQVFDAPITEAAFVGAAVGAAVAGLRPVVDLLFVDFIGVCFDQVLNQMAKLRYMSGGQVSVPVVLRAMYGAGMRRGAQHSQVLYPLVTHVPGLKVAVPSTPYDAKGLLIEAIRDPDPVVFFEHKLLYFTPGPVPEELYTIPFGQAATVRHGDDCTIVAIGRMAQFAVQAAEALAAEGVECEVIDPRTLSPLDTATIFASVERTGRLVVADEAGPRCGTASDIAALVAEHRFSALRSAVRTVVPPHTPQPFSPGLEDGYVPGAAEIAAAARAAVRAAPSRAAPRLLGGAP